MRVKTPAGLNINAKLPEEVAISILAEIISKLREEKNQSTQPESQLNMAEYFINPVCNIPVQKSTAKHVINRKGVDYYFCCDGCRDTFVAQPEKYELQSV